MVTITAIVPCYNEGAHIEEVYRQLRAELTRYSDYELLFIDDGSTDTTLRLIKEISSSDPRVKYVSFSRNFGLEAAFSAGFKYAQKEWTIQFDADLQSPPYEMHKLVQKAQEGYDAVFALRRQRHDPVLRRLGSSAQQWIARRLLHIELPPGGSVFRIIRTSVARKVVETRLGMPYFLATLPQLTTNYTCIPTNHHPRRHDKSKWRISKLFSHSFDLFLGFSFAPLLFVTSLLILAVVLTLVELLFVSSTYPPIWLGTLEGGLLSIFTLCDLAILSWYIKRLVLEAKKVQLFYIKESNIPILPEDSLYEFASLPREVHHVK